MLNKERAEDMYRLSAYFLARTMSDLPLDLILSVLFLLVVYFMAGLRLSAASFFLTILTVFLCIIAAQVCISKTTNNTIQTKVSVLKNRTKQFNQWNLEPAFITVQLLWWFYRRFNLVRAV